MKLEILSVNVGMPRVLARVNGEEVWSGIAKQAVTAEHVVVHSANIDGDGQADLTVHGGVDKAVYAYPAGHWPWWKEQTGLVCSPNTLGENLTLAGAVETEVRIGDRFAWGEAVLEISQPRAPCFKLALHTGREDIPGLMTASGRCGWYLRVLREGTACVRGELVRVQESDGPTVRDTFAVAFAPVPDRAVLRRIHACPALSAAWRKMLERKMSGAAR